MDLKDKNAVIIGAVSGIGLACAKQLLKNGVKKIVIIDYNESLFEKVSTELANEFGPNRVTLYKCDITNAEDYEKVFKTVIEELKTIDILHSNAGIVGEDIWRTLLNVNLNGAIHSLFLGEKHMNKQNGGQGGTIVLTSSILGLSGCIRAPIYSAAKHALIGLTRSYGDLDYFNTSGVRVMAICPAYTDSPLLTGCNLYKENVTLPAEILENIRKYPLQTCESVAEGIIGMLKNGSTGSVHVTENGSTYEIDMPCIIEHTYKVKLF